MKFHKILVFVAFLVAHHLAYCSAIDCSITPKSSDDHLGKLHYNLICNHSDYDVRPVKVNTTVTNVYFLFQPKRISIVEEKKIMKVDGFLYMRWQDERINWKPSEYGSIKRVELDTYDLWAPKLTTNDHYSNGWYEFLDEMDQYSTREVSIDFNGIVRQKMVVTLYGPCDFDLSNWPNDEWSCEMTLGKKAHDDGYVVVHFTNDTALDTSKLESDENWVIKKISDPAKEDIEERSEFIALTISLKRQRSTAEKIYVVPVFVSLIITMIPFWLTNKIFVRLSIHFLSTFLQIVLLQFVFSYLSERHGLRPIKIYDLYLSGLYLNLVGIIITAMNAKCYTKVEDPPKFIVDFLSMLAQVPYFGACCSVMMNDDAEKMGAFESDEETLVAGTVRVKYNKKWIALLNFIDKTVFFLILLYACIRAMM